MELGFDDPGLESGGLDDLMAGMDDLNFVEVPNEHGTSELGEDVGHLDDYNQAERKESRNMHETAIHVSL